MANTKITADNLAANAVNASSIADGVITPAKIASGDFNFSDNLGVGTSSINNPFSANTAAQIGDITEGLSLLTLAGTTQGSIYFADSTSGADRYAGYIDYNHSGNYMAFGGKGNGSEMVRIDSSGNVGIGNTTPSNNHANANRLVVGNGTAGGIANYVGTGTGWYAFSRDNANNTDAYDGGISYDGSRNLMFHTNAGAERVRITGAGNVGINWSAPTARLGIIQSGSSTPGLNITDGSSSDFHILAGYSSGLCMIGPSAGSLAIKTANTERMRIDSSGNVGIGGEPVASFSGYNGASLHVRQSSTSATAGSQLRLTNGQTGHGTADGSYLAQWGDLDFYIVNQENANMRFYTNALERMRIDSTGNVGIGTTSPSSYYSGADNLVVSQSSGEGGITIVTANNTYGNLYFADGTSGADAYRGGIIYGHSANNMNFYTNGNERMRITSGGDVLIGWSGGIYNDPAASSVEGISLRNPTGGNTATMIVAKNDSSAVHNIYSYRLGNSNYGRHIHFNHNGSEVGTINSTTSSTSYNTSSDYRLKENVVEMTGALDRVNQLQPKRFNFIVNPDTTVDGFLAHEVQDIVPEAITGVKDEMQEEEYEVTPAVLDEDGSVVTEAVMGTREVPKYQGIDQSKLVPLLTKAIQEQQTIIDDLKARIETLENA